MNIKDYKKDDFNHRITPMISGSGCGPVNTDPEMTLLRLKRNQMLTESDWTQMPDVKLSVEQKNAWTIYRQTLRDLPASFNSKGKVEWPIAP